MLNNQLPAQLTSRSGASNASYRSTGITETIPCSGTVLFSEDFESGIPNTWTIIDGDNRTPRPEIGLSAGWQGIVDYRDTSNHAAASPSWYTDPGKSNDWLISPAITLGSNSCLSWNAYSQDQYFLEGYEVRIASTPDTAAFLANSALFSAASASEDPTYSSVTLAAYAGQTVYFAFRQISDDKFVLVLDDIQVSNINNRDIGAFSLTYGAPEIGDTVAIRFEVANYGSDTITSFLAIYQIDNMPAKSMNINAVSLPPNHTVFFTHDSLFVSDSVDANLSLCAWTNLPNSNLDEDNLNDTTCTTLTIGHPVGQAEAFENNASMTIYPNPFSDELNIAIENWNTRSEADVRVYDIHGKLVFVQSVNLASRHLKLHIPSIPAGMYVLEIGNTSQKITRKLIRK